jgi:hypothetical protein
MTSHGNNLPLYAYALITDSNYQIQILPVV